MSLSGCRFARTTANPAISSTSTITALTIGFTSVSCPMVA
jgi:hypothetical protein